jgi:hypothetical protein
MPAPIARASYSQGDDMKFRVTCAIACTAAFMILLAPGSATAVSGAGAINLTWNTSARAEGMGSAGCGVPWGADTNHWANPGLLAFRPGVNYLHYEAEIAAGVADDIELTNDELTLQAYGVTLLWSRSPFDGNYLDMGDQVAVDESGNVVSEFGSYMQAESWGLGFDVVPLLDRLLHHEDPWSRYAAVGVGYVRRDFEDYLAPDNLVGPGGGRAQGSASDKGIAIRITPVQMDDFSDTFGLRAGVGLGWSVLADTDEFIRHVDADQSDPFPRAFVTGWSVHAALTLSPTVRARPERSLGRVLLEAVDPLLSFTLTGQTIKPGFKWTGEDYVYERDSSGRYDEDGAGWEIGLANILFLRGGNVTADYADIDDSTSGWGLNLQAGRMGGFRYDHATVPQAAGLPEVERKGWSIWVDPLEIFGR